MCNQFLVTHSFLSEASPEVGAALGLGLGLYRSSTTPVQRFVEGTRVRRHPAQQPRLEF
jgi:hypothetical protein